MDEIARYYQEHFEEADRLFSGSVQLEFARIREIIERHLPRVPARILDLAGGPGVYSSWLASLGYEVHLLDLTPRHVVQARHRTPAPRSAVVGDGRRLPYAGRCADAVLLLGPLYHLPERDDRLGALREAARVARPGAPLFVAAINRFASLLDGLVRGFCDDPRFQSILRRDLEDGQHRNPTDCPDYFTTAFFHHPDELRAEILEAGLGLVDLLGVEGPGFLAKDFEARWQDPARRAELLDLVRRVEREPTLWGLSQHLLAVARTY